MSEQLIMNPLGIITQPNKLGVVPPGAFREAYACVIRDPAKLETSPTWLSVQNIGSGATGGNVTPHPYVITFPGAWSNYALTLWQHANTNWAFSWNDLAALAAPWSDFLYNEQGYNPQGRQKISAQGRINSVTLRDRTLLNCDVGIMAWDYASPASGPQAVPRQSGLQAPASIQTLKTSTPGISLKNATYAHVTCVLRRVYADRYELVSAPSAACVVYNTTGSDYNLQHIVKLQPAFTRVGDIVEIYRTRAQAVSATGPAYVADNTDSDYYRVASRALTAADIAALSATIEDATPDLSMGEYLYTNDGVKGPAGAANQPPTARVLCTFAGHVHFFNLTQAPQFKLRTPVGWGFYWAFGSPNYDATGRLAGIGSRQITGTTTSGSNVITAVPAGDIIGIKIGQYINVGGGGWPTPWVTTVTAVGASTITVSTNSAASAAGTSITISDIIRIDNIDYAASDMDAFIRDLWVTNPGRFRPSILSRIQPGKRSWWDAPTLPADSLSVAMFDFWGDPTDATRQSFSVSATNGSNYDPPLPRRELSETAKVFPKQVQTNGWAWSEKDQPENVPPGNYNTLSVGEVFGALETRDAMFVATSGGLWRVSGTGGSRTTGYDWQAVKVSQSFRLAGPQAWCVMRETIFAVCEDGFVSIDSSGNISSISSGVVGDIFLGKSWPKTLLYTPSTVTFAVPNPVDNEVLVREPGQAADIMWRYNVNTNTFVWDYPGNAPLQGAFSEFLKAPIIGLDSNYGDVYAQIGTTFRLADVSYQPAYAANPFSLRHWQQIDIACDDNLNVIKVFANGLDCGQQTMAFGTHATYSRVSMSVPKEAPAIGNNISVSIQIPAAATQTALQGVALHYVELTDQRKNR